MSEVDVYLLLACTGALSTPSPSEPEVSVGVDDAVAAAPPPAAEPPSGPPDYDDRADITIGPLLPTLGGTLPWDAALTPLLDGAVCGEVESFPRWRTVACECSGVVCLIEHTVPAADADEARRLVEGPDRRVEERRHGGFRALRSEDTAALSRLEADRAALRAAAEAARAAGCVPAPPIGSEPVFTGVARDDIEPVFLRNADRLEGCLAAALARDPCASGTVGVSFLVEGGRVRGAYLSRTPDRELGRCVLDVVRRARFPYASTGEVEYAWYLSPLPDANGPALRPEPAG